MSPRARHDAILGIGYTVFLLGHTIRGAAPHFYQATPFVPKIHRVAGLSIITVFFLWTLSVVAGQAMPWRAKAPWIFALVSVMPLSLPFAFIRFVRPRVAGAKIAH